MQYAQINKQNQDDLLLMELIALPLSFLVLVWVFGGLLAAALPMALGALAVVGSMSVLRLDHLHHRSVDLRAQPEHRDGSGAGHRLHTADRQPLSRRIGRGQRPRRGADPDHGHRPGAPCCSPRSPWRCRCRRRWPFPMYFLKSFAYAGVATVAFVATASIVITPAAIVLLGPRLDALDVRRLLRRILAPARAGAQTGRAAVLVPVEQVRDAPLGADRPGRRRRCCCCSGFRSSR